MADIKAFVAHSFLEPDKEVVGKFLKYLQQLSKRDGDFTWESAEDAEPNQVYEKVLRIIRHKNVFIGICTKNEFAIDPKSLAPHIFQPSYRKARVEDFKPKASDWIIQEIGMAVALGLKVILLIEKGVRKPGGLQGDVEYIEFERHEVEKSFGKIVEMFTAVSQKSPDAQTVAPEVTSKVGDQAQRSQPPAVPSDQDVTTPTPAWTHEDYERAWFHMLLTDNNAEAERISNAYLQTPDGMKEEKAAAWKGNMEGFRLRFGKGGSFEGLKRLSETHPTNPEILENLAEALARYDDHGSAAKKYEEAASHATDKAEVDRLRGFAAVEYVKTASLSKANEIIEELRSGVRAGRTKETRLLFVLRNIAELSKDDALLVVILERSVDLNVADTDARFTLAHKHSELGNDDMALFHYLKIPRPERDSATLNNLGVSYGQFGIQGMAVKAFQGSAEKGETLAMSNLANKLLNQGFVEEAQILCDKALGMKPFHENIGLLVTRLKKLPEEEQEKRDNVLKKSKEKADFFQLLGRSVVGNTPRALAGAWVSAECVLEARVLEDKFVFSGTVEREASALAVLGGMSRITKGKIEYSGRIAGRTLVGVVEEEPTHGASTAATALGLTERKVLMVVSDDESEVKVMIYTSTGNPSFQTFKRVTPIKTTA